MYVCKTWRVKNVFYYFIIDTCRSEVDVGVEVVTIIFAIFFKFFLLFIEWFEEKRRRIISLDSRRSSGDTVPGSVES